MSLDVWFQQDIRNVLMALHSAQAAQPALREPLEINAARECEAYRAGFQAALQSVALAFDIALEPARLSVPIPARQMRYRLRESGETYTTRISGAAEAQYE